MQNSIVVQASGVLQDVTGPNDAHIKLIEDLTGAVIRPRGNELQVESDDPKVCSLVNEMLVEMQQFFFQGRAIDPQLVRAVFDGLSDETKSKESFGRESIVVPGGFQAVFPKTVSQAIYMRTLAEKEISFAIGPAGTGKTFLSVAFALQEVLEKRSKKLILSRPVVEAGESLGFLPGDMHQKLHPYVRPLYDAIGGVIPPEIIQRLHDQGSIEVAPLAYMRGRSLNNCCIVLDEAQNTTVEQMKMFLTRMGAGSRVIITGDVTQIDLPRRQKSGLVHALHVLHNIDEIGFHYFSASDVVRHPLVQKIITAYDCEGGGNFNESS